MFEYGSMKAIYQNGCTKESAGEFGTNLGISCVPSSAGPLEDVMKADGRPTTCHTPQAGNALHGELSVAAIVERCNSEAFCPTSRRVRIVHRAWLRYLT